MTHDLAVIQPAKLARELRRVLLERGVRIFEGTPMLRVEAGRAGGRGHARGHGARPSGGAHHAPGRRGCGTSAAPSPCASSMVVTEPVPDLAERCGWGSHMGVADLREMLYYLRPTADGRVAIGGGSMGIAFGARQSRRR